ncbi:MAG: hypothetical protein WAN48_00255 [Actinomycetes bacterium]
MRARVLRWGLLALFVFGLAGRMVWGGALISQDSVMVAYLAFAATGWVLSQRRPNNPEGWVFLSTGAMAGLFGVANVGVAQALDQGQPIVWWGMLAGWTMQWLWAPLFTLSTTFPLLLFPDGHLTRFWRWVAVVAAVLSVWVALLGMASPILGAFGDTAVANPTSPSFVSTWGNSDLWPVRNLGLLGIAATALAAGIGVFIRARRAHGVERLQFHWLAYGGTLMAVILVLDGMPFLPLSDAHHEGLSSALFSAAMALLPLSMGVAILRYHLYDIDRVISRTAAYAVVSVALVSTYAAVVWLLSRFVDLLVVGSRTEPGSSPPWVIAAATLAAATVARPALHRVQAVVDRRFNRSRYDAIQTVDHFGHGLRTVVEPERVEEDLLAAVSSTIEPSTVSLWLRR